MSRGRNQYNQISYFGIASAALAGLAVGRIVKMAIDSPSHSMSGLDVDDFDEGYVADFTPSLNDKEDIL